MKSDEEYDIFNEVEAYEDIFLGKYSAKISLGVIQCLREQTKFLIDKVNSGFRHRDYEKTLNELLLDKINFEKENEEESESN